MSDPEFWLACEHPERPLDDRCRWHMQCRGCGLAVQAAIVNRGDDGLLDLVRQFIEKACPDHGANPGGDIAIRGRTVYLMHSSPTVISPGPFVVRGSNLGINGGGIFPLRGADPA